MLKRVNPRVIAAGCGILVVPLVLGALSFWGGGSPARELSRLAQKPGPGNEDGAPCPGRQVALEQAKAETRAPILLPDQAIANEGNVSQAWLCGESMYIKFGSGVRLRIAPNGFENATAHFAQEAAEKSAFESLGSVRNNTALFSDPSVAPSGGGVDWVEGAWYYSIAVRGKTSMQGLRDLVASLRSY